MVMSTPSVFDLRVVYLGQCFHTPILPRLWGYDQSFLFTESLASGHHLWLCPPKPGLPILSSPTDNCHVHLTLDSVLLWSHLHGLVDGLDSLQVPKWPGCINHLLLCPLLQVSSAHSSYWARTQCLQHLLNKYLLIEIMGQIQEQFLKSQW